MRQCLVWATSASRPLFPALIVASLALAYFGSGLGAREVTLLESQDLSFAAELFRTFRLTVDHSPLHFALLNLWLRSGGVSVALLRLPSALCVAAGAAFVYRLAERVAGTAAALFAALLFTTNPEIVDQARSLRLYGFALLLCAVCLERAHAFGDDQRREAGLFGFLAGAVLAVHTHLFLWLWVLPLLALVAARAFAVLTGVERRRAVLAGALALVFILPQVVHGVVALGFTHDRHAVYVGVSSHFGAFAQEIGNHLLLGESEPKVCPPGYVLALIGLLPLLGAARLPRRLRAVALAVVAPPFLAAFTLSFTSEVEARYLCFALPGLAVLAGVALAALPSVVGAGAGLAVVGVSLFTSVEAYGAPATDWYAAADRLEGLADKNDVVAVFPGYWAETFRFYTRRRELVPVTYPIDLERVLARGRPVLLVANGGRYRGDLDAYLDAFTERRLLFSSDVRDVFEVHEVRRRTPAVAAPAHAPASVVFTGIVGAGGYDWLAGSGSEGAFAELRPLFAAGDLAVSGYAPYAPPWLARLLLGPALGARLRPQFRVATTLERVGVRAVAISSERGGVEAASAALARAHLAVVPCGGGTPKPLIYELGTQRVALIALGTLASAAPSLRLVSLVAQARAGLKSADALVVFVPAPARFDGLPTPEERILARRLVDAGADVVIGNGGYVAKPVERYRGAVIAYSLGSLVVPPTLDLAQREATGLALRVRFEAGRPFSAEALATTVDDQGEPRLGRLDAVPEDPTPEFAALIETFSTARVWTSSATGAPPRLLEYRASAPVPGWAAWFENEVRAWIPWSPRGTSLQPFAAGFFDGNSYAGVRAVRSLGEPRAAIEIDASPGTCFNVELPRMTLGGRIDVECSLPDDRELSKFRPLYAENVNVAVEGGPTFSEAVPFHSGWHEWSLDTTALKGALRHITLGVSSPASHFPVAFALRVAP